MIELVFTSDGSKSLAIPVKPILQTRTILFDSRRNLMLNIAWCKKLSGYNNLRFIIGYIYVYKVYYSWRAKQVQYFIREKRQDAGNSILDQDGQNKVN